MSSFIFYLIVYPILLFSSMFIGRRTAIRSLKKKHQWKPTGLESGLMGFYALLISFTLVQSGNHASERNAMIHTIADDMSEVLRISTTYEPGLHARVKAHYADLYKIIKTPFGYSSIEVSNRIRKIDKLDDSLDREMYQYIAQKPQARESIINLLAKTDRMESIYYRLMHSYNETIPQMILLILVLFSMFIGFLIGFVEKFYDNHVHIIPITFVVISVIILNVIHDLDNPNIGFIKPNFNDITEVMQSFKIETN
jgi:hypothetical protein